MMSKIDEDKSPVARVSINNPPNLPIVFADGVTKVNVTFPNSKITFHVVSGTEGAAEGEIEHRTNVVQLNLPTHVLLKLCRGILAGSIENQGSIDDAIDNVKGEIRKTLSGFPLPRPTAKK